MITAAFTLDIGGFLSSLNKAKNALAASMGGGAAGVAIAGVGVAFGAAAAAVGLAAKGMYGAMDEGRALENLKEKTGVGVARLMVLKAAFEQAGIGADQVESSIGTLQEKLVTAAQVGGEAGYAFLRLGLSARELSTTSADAAMEKVSAALSKVSNSAERAKLANELLGVSGNKLASIFVGGGIERAQETLGNSAELMAKNSGLFSAVVSLLDSASLKLQAIFVGMASEVAPSLIQVLEDLNSLDFTEVGVQLGKIVGFVYESFSNGKIAELLFYGISYGIKKGLNSAFNWMEKMLTGLFAWIAASFESIFSADYITASFMGILGIAQQFMAILFSGMANLMNYLAEGISKIPVLGKQLPATTGGIKEISKMLSEIGTGFTERSSSNITMGNALKEKIDKKIAQEVSDAYDYAGDSKYFSMTKQDFGLEETFKGLAKSLKKRNERTRLGYSGAQPGENQPPPMQRFFIAPIASALQQIGGGGGFTRVSNMTGGDPLLEQARAQKSAQDQTNQLLVQIAANTGNWSGKEVQSLLK
jgi:hypothetical protein